MGGDDSGEKIVVRCKGARARVEATSYLDRAFPVFLLLSAHSRKPLLRDALPRGARPPEIFSSVKTSLVSIS